MPLFSTSSKASYTYVDTHIKRRKLGTTFRLDPQRSLSCHFDSPRIGNKPHHTKMAGRWCIITTNIKRCGVARGAARPGDFGVTPLYEVKP